LLHIYFFDISAMLQ